jgi:hypothetical protein
MDWRCGSSGRAPALQAQSPEFKPWSYQKRKRREKGEGEEEKGREKNQCRGKKLFFLQKILLCLKNNAVKSLFLHLL